LILFRGSLKKHPEKYFAYKIDQVVGTLIMLATVPLGLTYLLATNGELLPRLFWIVIILFSISIIAAGAGAVVRWSRQVKYSEGAEKIIPTTFAVMALFSPIFRGVGGLSGIPRTYLAKFAFYLALPPLVGLLIKSANNQLVTSQSLIPNLDALTVLLVGALTIRVIIEILEKAFRLYKLETFFSYFRVFLGISLIALTITSL